MRSNSKRGGRARARRWHAGLRAVGEAEALSSLAGHAFDNPADVFPIVEPGSIRITAIGIGHPLIASEKCVRNDVTLGGTTGPRMLIVSGSNMSGKSTLLARCWRERGSRAGRRRGTGHVTHSHAGFPRRDDARAGFTPGRAGRGSSRR